MLDKIKSNVAKFYEVYGDKVNKINGVLMAVPVAVSSMVIPTSAAALDIPGTADSVITLMGTGLTFIESQPVLALSFVAGLMGTVIFGNIKKAKRAVK